jgi:hypothetical protein
MTIDSITTPDPLFAESFTFITANPNCEIVLQDGVPVEVCITTPSFQSTTEQIFSTEDTTAGTLIPTETVPTTTEVQPAVTETNPTTTAEAAVPNLKSSFDYDYLYDLLSEESRQ